MLVHCPWTLVLGGVLLLVHASDAPGNICLLVPCSKPSCCHMLTLHWCQDWVTCPTSQAYNFFPDFSSFLSWTLDYLQSPTWFGSRLPLQIPLLSSSLLLSESQLYIPSFCFVPWTCQTHSWLRALDWVNTSGMLMSLVFTGSEPRCHLSDRSSLTTFSKWLVHQHLHFYSSC